MTMYKLVEKRTALRVHIWAALSSYGCVGPVVLEGTMQQDTYKDLLEKVFLPVALTNAKEDPLFYCKMVPPHI